MARVNVVAFLFLFASVVQCITDSDQTAILNLHNTARRCAQLKPLSWDNALETTAQNWANRCNFAHNSGRTTDYKGNGGALSSVGENIAMGGPVSSYGMQPLFTLWFDERKDYTCGTPIGGSNFGAIGHYTQIMWEDSTALGCGVAQCSGSNFLVCNYATAGNYIGELPYPVAQCPTGTCTPSVTDTGAPPTTQEPTKETTTSTTTKNTPTLTAPTLTPTTTTTTPITTTTQTTRPTQTPTSDAPVPTGEPVPVEALITVTLKIAPNKLNLQTFTTEIAGVLGIPTSALANIQVDIDKSTDTTTVIHFTITNSAKPDGTRVDPIAAAYQLRDLASRQDPLLQTTAMLQNMEVNTIEEQQVEAASSNFVGSQTFIIIIASVGGAILIGVAITITIIIVRKRRNAWY